MKYTDAQVGLAAVYLGLVIAVVISPSISVAICLIATGALFLVTGHSEEAPKQDLDAKKMGFLLGELNELKGRVSQLSLSIGLKGLKKD